LPAAAGNRRGEVFAWACVALPVTNKTIAGDVRTTLPQYFLLIVQIVVERNNYNFFSSGPWKPAQEGQNAQGRESRYYEKFYRQYRGLVQCRRKNLTKIKSQKLRKLNTALLFISGFRLSGFRCEIG
jgi:hypothetical protein